MKQQKLKSVHFNNRKKQITIDYTPKKQITIHFGQLGITQNISKAWIDRETGGQSVGFEFVDGKTDYMPYDQPLALVKDPEFVLQTQMEVLISKIKQELKKKKVSKRYLGEQLGTSDNQVQRLLDPTILNKNLEQLYKVASLLNMRFEIRIKEAA